MKNRISFFGASVTQQHNGYWKYFKDSNQNFNVNSYGFGARHLSDAGVCYIDEVLSSNPEYCFIDWFSTGYIKYNEDKFDEIQEYVDTIINKFYKNNVKLIFLIFPDKTVDKTEIYKKLNNYLTNLKIPVLDLSECFEKNINEILRDGIHTTDYGANQYSEKISEFFFNEIYNKHEIPKNYPKETKFCNIKKIEFNKIIKNRLVLEGPSEIIGMSQIVGPYTGLIDIDGVIFNNWDRWCYYEREMVNLKFKVNKNTIIKVLQDDFDRSLCEHNINWNIDKFLKIIDIFYVGENLKIIEYN
jgi:hypothetical protein